MLNVIDDLVAEFWRCNEKGTINGFVAWDVPISGHKAFSFLIPKGGVADKILKLKKYIRQQYDRDLINIESHDAVYHKGYMIVGFHIEK